MAIRTQLTDNVRRVITKVVEEERRVSCSCCETGECCMYPADQLGIGYTEDDLPDTIEAPSGDGPPGGPRPRGTFTRNGSGYEGTYDGDPFTYQIIGTSWQSLCNCLFYCSDNDFTDEFADGYDYDNAGVGQTGFLERTSLCVWSDQLYYYAGNNPTLEFYYNGPPHRWIFISTGLQQEEGGGVWEKDDPQNGPSGTYSPSTNVTGNSFAGLGTITLTAS